MKKYLNTGLVVEAIVIVLRTILGKTQEPFKEGKSSILFWIALLLGIVVNVVLWPITIIGQIFLTKEGL